ncbi:MAG TPA: methyltransferase, partial [bacterium]|nr:methyltransferase [bacterium]
MISLERSFKKTESDDITVDKIYSRDIEICQKKQGYRFNSDSVILSWFIYRILGGKKIHHSLEIGSGTGVVPIILNRRGFLSTIECVEVQAGLFDLLKKNISKNKLEDHLLPKNIDFREITKDKNFKFDLIFTNPPYFGVDTGKINPDNEKAISKHEFFGSLADFMSVSKKILKPGGHFVFIYPL